MLIFYSVPGTDRFFSACLRMGRAYGPWTPEDDSRLIEAVRANTSLQRLAVRFKRSKESVRKRIRDLGLEPPQAPRLPTVQPEPRV
jgi:hypothetical protein